MPYENTQKCRELLYSLHPVQSITSMTYFRVPLCNSKDTFLVHPILFVNRIKLGGHLYEFICKGCDYDDNHIFSVNGTDNCLHKHQNMMRSSTSPTELFIVSLKPLKRMLRAITLSASL